MGFSVTANSPASGYIAWADAHLVYDGVDYPISNGNTNKRYVYWVKASPATFQVSDTYPALTTDDCIVFLNKNGVPISVLTATATDGDLVVPGTITSSAIATDAIDATHIKSDAVIARHILAGAITAEKLSVAQLSAISANLGTMTAGNFTLNTTGFIRGGATNFSSGTGFWMGYDSAKYKFRVGAPGSSRMEWDGSAFNIYDAAGNLTISSGVVDWAGISGTGKPADGATRNVYRGEWATATAYNVGDIVTVNGTSWGCLLYNVSAAGNQPPATGTSNTWWTLHAAKGDTGPIGPGAVQALMSNEAHVFPADSSGAVTSYSGSGTQIRVYEGQTELAYDGVGTANGTWKITSAVTNITRGTLTDSGTYLTVGDHSGVAAGTDTSKITYTISGKTTAGAAFAFTKDQTFTKSKAGSAGPAGADGATGPAGPTVLVTSDRPATFTATDGTLDAGQSNLILTANTNGISSPTYAWTFSGLQSNPTVTNGQSVTITQAQFGTAKSAIATCTVNGTFVDKVTIVRLEKSTAQAGATVGATIGVNLDGQITPANASTYIANAAIGTAQIADASITAAKIGSISLVGVGNFSVKTAAAGARMEMDSRFIKVYDTAGTLRVQLGDLSV